MFLVSRPVGGEVNEMLVGMTVGYFAGTWLLGRNWAGLRLRALRRAIGARPVACNITVRGSIDMTGRDALVSGCVFLPARPNRAAINVRGKGSLLVAENEIMR